LPGLAAEKLTPPTYLTIFTMLVIGQKEAVQSWKFPVPLLVRMIPVTRAPSLNISVNERESHIGFGRKAVAHCLCASEKLRHFDQLILARTTARYLPVAGEI
jgi:hypothetical protein